MPRKAPPPSGPSTFALAYLFVGFVFVFSIIATFSVTRTASPIANANETGVVAGAATTDPAVEPPTIVRAAGASDFDGLLTARAAVVMDARSGQLLFKKNESLQLPLASLTKLATVAVVLDGEPDLAPVVEVTSVDVAAEPNASELGTGERVTAKDLLMTSLVGSSNSAAHALARSTGIPTAVFVSRMNALAESLDAVNTRFAEPTGVDPKNVSTAAEFARLAEYAFRSSLIRDATTQSAYRFTSVVGKAHDIRSTNKLLNNGIRVLAGKTGSLAESRYSFVALVADDAGHEIVVVTLGAQSDERRFSETKALAQWAFGAHIWND